MPIRRRRAAPIRRRKNFRRKRAAPRRTRVPRSVPLIVENRKLVRLKYSDVDRPTISLTASALQYNEYNLNGLYDVNTAVASTAVPGFAEWNKFYNRYRVFAVTIKVECVNTHATEGLYLITHVQPDAAPASFSNWAQFREMGNNKGSRCTLMGPASGQNKARHKIHSYLPTLFGAGPYYRSDANYAGFTGGVDAASNPARMLSAYVVILSQGGSTATVTVPVKVEIEMFVEFFDRIDLTT